MPQPDHSRPQYRHCAARDHSSRRSGRLGRICDHSGSGHSRHRRFLGEHLARHVECALSGRAADRHKFCAGRILHHADFLEALGVWAPYLPLNPLFAAVDVIRAPLLGEQPMHYCWTVLMITTVLGAVITFALFVKFRPRITYWI